MPTANKVWTVLEVLKWSEDFLSRQGFKYARSDAEQLLMAALQVERIFLYTNHDRPLSEKERTIYREYISRRAKQEPIQYITGSTYFMGLKFLVDKSVLIPRPDTEILIETFVSAVKRKFNGEHITIIDIGTGSGAIAVSLAKFLPQARIIAVDNSLSALGIARRNAELNQVVQNIEFMESDILEKIIHQHIENKVFLVSNPPYIDGQDISFLSAEVRNYEPHNALYGGQDGLKFYRAIIDQGVIFGERLAGVFFEVGYNQAEQVKKMLTDKFKMAVEVCSDLGGIPRVVYTLLK
jgi:release factor glutamine methyltransferase